MGALYYLQRLALERTLQGRCRHAYEPLQLHPSPHLTCSTPGEGEGEGDYLPTHDEDGRVGSKRWVVWSEGGSKERVAPAWDMQGRSREPLA